MNSGEDRSKAIRDDDAMSVLAFLKACQTQCIAISVILSVSLMLALLLAFSLPVKYRAETVVRVAEKGSMGLPASIENQLGGLASLVGVNLGSGGNLDALPVLKSGDLAENFVRSRKLQDVLGGGSQSLTIWQAVRKFTRSVLVVNEDRRSSLVTVSIVWEDPDVAADWANSLVVMANETIRARDKRNAERSLSFLNSQLTKTTVVEIQKTLFKLIESETRTLMLADAREEYALVVVDHAVPPEIRDSPRRTIIVLLGLALGMLVSSVYVFLRLSFQRIQ